MRKTTQAPRLNAKQIQTAVFKRLVKYKKLNFFEQFAMYMGMAQLHELQLKRLLVSQFNFKFEDLDRWTMGRAARELKDKGLRQDYIQLLEPVVRSRNHIAHELLANELMLASILNGKTGRLNRKELELGIYELEQIMFLHEWTEKHGLWG